MRGSLTLKITVSKVGSQVFSIGKNLDASMRIISNGDILKRPTAIEIIHIITSKKIRKLICQPALSFKNNSIFLI
jgi:hypothetical protein